jgi:hypothetical protein
MVFVSPFLLNNNYRSPVLAMDPKMPKAGFFGLMVDLQIICA